MDENNTLPNLDPDDVLPDAPPAMSTKYLAKNVFGGAVSVRTLEMKRKRPGAGPPFKKDGRRVFYLKADVARWLTQQRMTHLPPRISTPRSGDHHPVS